MRRDGDQVFRGTPVHIDRPDVAPVAALTVVHVGDGVGGEVVGDDFGGLDHARDDVLAEVVGRIGTLGVALDLTDEGVAVEDVESHGGEAGPRRVGIDRRLFAETDDPAGGVAVDDAELVHLRGRDRDHGDRHLGLGRAVELEHLADVHLIDVVGAKNADFTGFFVLEDVEVLIDGVGAAAEPLRADVHRCRDRGDVVAELGRELPASRQMLHQRARLVLGQHADLGDAGVHEVREDEVDDAVAPAERHGRLGPVAGERIESLALAAGEDQRDDVARAASSHGFGPRWWRARRECTRRRFPG